jgi:hypothetical protein
MKIEVSRSGRGGFTILPSGMARFFGHLMLVIVDAAL